MDSALEEAKNYACYIYGFGRWFNAFFFFDFLCISLFVVWLCCFLIGRHLYVVSNAVSVYSDFELFDHLKMFVVESPL